MWFGGVLVGRSKPDISPDLLGSSGQVEFFLVAVRPYTGCGSQEESNRQDERTRVSNGR